jgi:hypothetical protein
MPYRLPLGRYLAEFKAHDMVAINVTKCKKKNIRIITVKNYNKYQQKSNNLKPQCEVSRKLSQDAESKTESKCEF